MKKIKQYKKWVIYKLNPKEQEEYGFAVAVIHPNNVGAGLLSPADTDWECNTLDEAMSWINNYED